MKNIEVYFMWLLIYSVCGWVIESLLFSLKEHKFVNRGILKGPYCPVYGIGAIVNAIAIDNTNNVILAAVFCAAVIFILSLATSAFEKKFSGKKNIQKPILTLIWSVASAIFINIIHLTLGRSITSIHPAIMRLVMVLVGVLLLIDAIASIYIKVNNNNADA